MTSSVTSSTHGHCFHVMVKLIDQAELKVAFRQFCGEPSPSPTSATLNNNVKHLSYNKRPKRVVVNKIHRPELGRHAACFRDVFFGVVGNRLQDSMAGLCNRVGDRMTTSAGAVADVCDLRRQQPSFELRQVDRKLAKVTCRIHRRFSVALERSSKTLRLFMICCWVG